MRGKMSSKQSESRFSARCPELGTGPVPIEPNVSPEYFERERERIFKRSWLCVGRVDEVPAVGDYFAKDLEIVRTGVIILRGKDGRIQAFHDVCRHRGNRIAPSCSGNTKSFVCGFHGWAYDLAGKLVHIPDEEQFHDLDKTDYGLRPVATDTWEGFIFINVDPSPTQTLAEFIGEFYSAFQGYPFDSMELVVKYEATLAVNWKVLMEIFQECYHVGYIHSRTVADVGTGRDNPFGHLLSTRLYERHRSASVYYNAERKPSPAEALAFRYGPTIVQGNAGESVLPWGVNPDRDPTWGFDINVIFPNVILDVAIGSFWTQSFWPISVDRTSYEVKLYMKPAKTAGEKISQEFSKVLMRDAFREDLSRQEVIQSNLASGLIRDIPLSDQEIALRHAYKIVENMVGRCLGS
jgi:phenylpropionate dioxygenase-like ring-hydroxylating dioxygenase large terminal subunit